MMEDYLAVFQYRTNGLKEWHMKDFEGDQKEYMSLLSRLDKHSHSWSKYSPMEQDLFETEIKGIHIQKGMLEQKWGREELEGKIKIEIPNMSKW